MAFSDLFLEDVRAYREERLARASMQGLFPLWGRDTAELAQEMVRAEFRAILVCVDPRALDPSFAGRAFDLEFLADLPEGVDPCGENGEFLTGNWMNNSTLPRNPSSHLEGLGFDMVVGQREGTRVRSAYIRMRSADYNIDNSELPTKDWVIPTGGGYFFAPSISAPHQLGAAGD